MTLTNEQNTQDSGLVGHVIQDGIEILIGQSLLGFDFEQVPNFGDGWVSIKAPIGSCIYLHTTPDLILLSLKDLDGLNVSVGNVPEKSSTTRQPSSGSGKKKKRSASSIPSITSEPT